MKHLYLGLVIAAGMAVSVTAPCQKGQTDRSGGYAWGSPYNRLYSTASVITFSGKVTGVQLMSPLAGMDDGVILLVKTSNGGTALVDVGPAWYVNNQRTRIATGDRIRVTGSKVIMDRRGTILAQRIDKGSKTLLLRGATGDPMWWAYQAYPNGVPADVAGAQTAYIGTIGGLHTTTVDGVVTDDVLLQTPNGDVTVNLGPAWFVDRQPMVFQLGSNITVYSGNAPFQVGNVTVLPAWQIANASGLLNLRSANGMPVWNGWGGR